VMVFIWLALFGHASLAQGPPLPSVSVNADMTVTYRVTAPNAKEVLLIDSVLTREPGLPMTRGSDGVWTVTAGPYEAGDHQYVFLIDGVRTGDFGAGRNTERLPRPATIFEIVQVRGADPLPVDLQNVPHGVLHLETFPSTHFAREVECYVYTPPGYRGSTKRYPVLYLLHGGMMGPYVWPGIGAQRIADNLIAAGLPELIIVMPDTSAENRMNQPQPLTERYLLEEVIPFIEANYRTTPRRYLAGHSIGAGHAWNIVMRSPEAFSAVAAFGAGLAAADPPLEQSYPKLLDADAINEQVPLIYISVPQTGPNAGANAERFRASLERLGIKHHFNLPPGGQTSFNGTRWLIEFLTFLKALPEP
jgi:enterochelin esterase-like enzyme